MSDADLYLVLRSKLDMVADWVELGTPALKAARERLGLSYEGVARQIPVSSKTYERYEKRGRVPRTLLAKFAEVLQLEVEQPARERIGVSPQPSDDHLRQLVQEELAEMREQVERILALLEQNHKEPPRSRRASS